MFSFDFSSKLQKLNPQLFINTDDKRLVRGDWWTTGIYLKDSGGRKGRSSSAMANVSTEAQKLLRDTMDGHVNKFVCPCPVNFIPEYDVFYFERHEAPKIMAMGWRSILVSLAKRGLVDLGKAKKIFNCSGLGESNYDRSSRTEKIARLEEYA